jgi:hypothetical protein
MEERASSLSISVSSAFQVCTASSVLSIVSSSCTRIHRYSDTYAHKHAHTHSHDSDRRIAPKLATEGRVGKICVRASARGGMRGAARRRCLCRAHEELLQEALCSAGLQIQQIQTTPNGRVQSKPTSPQQGLLPGQATHRRDSADLVPRAVCRTPPGSKSQTCIAREPCKAGGRHMRLSGI